MVKRVGVCAVLAVALLAALPAVAVDSAIQRGIDPWTTVPESTYAGFTNNPIPAGFFCSEFTGFDGRIWLRGVPLVSDNQQGLGTTDTIVERLDDAVFNKRGVARTRVQVRALQLEGIESLKTVCGEYKVRVTLDGEQPIVTMRILRNNAQGGRFQVPLELNTKVIFTRVDNEAEQFEISERVRFAVNPYHAWSYRNLVPEAKRVNRVMVDTDWDGAPDTFLPGTSNFAAGGTGLSGQKATLVDHGGDDGHGVQ